jgi:hypothetical protein
LIELFYIRFKKDELRSISNILGLPATGRNTDHVERILNFLIKPIDEGKKIPGRKSAARNIKKRSTNSKESIDTNQETITEVNILLGAINENSVSFFFLFLEWQR